MKPVDFLIIAAVALVLFCAAFYVIRAKKKGQKCIGCPEGTCSGQCSGCSCGCDRSKTN